MRQAVLSARTSSSATVSSACESLQFHAFGRKPSLGPALVICAAAATSSAFALASSLLAISRLALVRLSSTLTPPALSPSQQRRRLRLYHGQTILLHGLHIRQVHHHRRCTCLIPRPPLPAPAVTDAACTRLAVRWWDSERRRWHPAAGAPDLHQVRLRPWRELRLGLQLRRRRPPRPRFEREPVRGLHLQEGT